MTSTSRTRWPGRWTTIERRARVAALALGAISVFLAYGSLLAHRTADPLAPGALSAAAVVLVVVAIGSRTRRRRLTVVRMILFSIARRRWRDACCPFCGQAMDPKLRANGCAECGATLAPPSIEDAPAQTRRERFAPLLVVAGALVAAHLHLAIDVARFRALAETTPEQSRTAQRSIPFSHATLLWIPPSEGGPRIVPR